MENKAVITGDIINSSQIPVDEWMKKLKEVLSEITEDKSKWEIYRGDSFQFSTPQKKAMSAVLLVKSAMKTIEGIDVRMSIGIGLIEYQSEKIQESNGSAFVHSGRKFESLKKQTLGIQTDNETFDSCFNLLLEFVSFVSTSWKPTTAKVVYSALRNPELNQTELAKLLHKKSQGTISSALKRAGFEELEKLIDLYESKIEKIEWS